MEVEKVQGNERTVVSGQEEVGGRRSTRQRFPVLKYWRNETVRYERRLSQAIPTISQVVVDVDSVIPRIQRKRIHMFPYKLNLVQVLEHGDYEGRLGYTN